MIKLDQNDKKWIKLCKGHYKTQYPPADTWMNTLKPLFTEIYGWNPDEDNNYPQFLNTMFNKLLDIFLLIQDDRSGSNRQLRMIFEAAFYKTFARDEEQPIERAISMLCGLIQSNTVITKEGEQRYKLTVQDI